MNLVHLYTNMHIFIDICVHRNTRNHHFKPGNRSRALSGDMELNLVVMLWSFPNLSLCVWSVDELTAIQKGTRKVSFDECYDKCWSWAWLRSLRNDSYRYGSWLAKVELIKRRLHRRNGQDIMIREVGSKSMRSESDGGMYLRIDGTRECLEL